MGEPLHFGKWISNPSPGEEVVITGISGRFPESNNMREFQENLFTKKDMVTDDARRGHLNHPEIPIRKGKIYNINKVDAGYYGLHYRQADILDPLIRKFLECAVEAAMDAGVNPCELEGSRTGVYVGACYSDMEIETLSNIIHPQNFGVTGYLRSFVPNRISYFLKLKGPSFILDSACSSSLNALELAFKAIRTGQCDSAFVGGVNLLLHPAITRQFFRLGVLSTDGTCKVFDDSADGYVRSETIACVFLQKENNARRIYSEIIYSRVNGDGFKSLGITYPSSQMQKELMTDILQDSEVDASQISFLEAHGTGTEVGDPEEAEAIDSAIAKKRTKPLLIGSVKCSVGHAEPSSGLCSIAKVIIAMETGYIPPNINLRKIKKGLDGFESGRMKAITELTELDGDDAIVGVNNFGFGGNNCHVLLRRFNKTKRNKGIPDDDAPRLVCVSGRTKAAVETLIEDVSKRPLDGEHVGLLHQIFKKDIRGHIYRGFTILSKTGTIKTDVKRFSHNQNSLYVFFGLFEHGYKIIQQYLLAFPCFRTTIKKINDLLDKAELNGTTLRKRIIKVGDNHFGSFVVQIGIIEILKSLELCPTVLYGDPLGKLVSAYYYEQITLKSAIQEACQTVESDNFLINFSELDKLKQDFAVGFFSVEQIINKPASIFLNISDKISDISNSLVLIKNKKVQFLEVLGRLYEEGYNPQLHKLYPSVQYPVSRTTPMIAPMVQWDYSKSWYTYKFREFPSREEVTQQEHNVSPILYEDQKYMTGHVIDGRNLVPATEYLRIVWKTLVQNNKFIEMDDLPIVFENCRFIRAVTVPTTGAVKLLVSIQKGSGEFQVTEKNSVVVTGRIFSHSDIEKYQTNLGTLGISDERTEFLEQDEIYRELYLRGYNYSGLFKGIVKCNVDASAALIRWEKNWTTFIDKMLQLKILQMDTKFLYVPVGIKRLTINPLQHVVFAEKQERSLCPVYCYKENNVIKSDNIEICGINAAPITKRKLPYDPVLEKYVFVPNITNLELTESVRVNTQIILENSLEHNFKAVEIIDDMTNSKTELLLPLVCKALNDIPLIVLNLVISTKDVLEPTPGVEVRDFVLTPTSDMLLIVATKIFQRPNLLKQTLSALNSNGFLLTREDIDFVSENVENVEILTEHTTKEEKIILFRSVKESEKNAFVEVTSRNFDWLPQLQNSLKHDSDVVVYSQNVEPEGTIGLVNCLRREPGGSKVRCLFMMDETQQFDILNPLYKKQIRKQLAMNIYKGNEWGTYRHLLLNDVQDAESEHVFVNNSVKGDLSSLKWFEGSLRSQIKPPNNKLLVYNYYSAVNFKDIMIASGRVSIDMATHRLEQECCLGFEYCGVDSDGRRVMGMTNNSAMATILVADTKSALQVPDNWTLEDASTVMVVYTTVLYSLLKLTTLKARMTILIHSATGGIGLAALNVCLYHGCDIYVTVGTQEKRDYLRQHFPQIPDSHIGNSRDTSFEEMIKTGTSGRGVDVVLNSLSEEKLIASVRCTAPGGNFIEIGKFDLGKDSSLDLLLLKKNVTYHGAMIDRIFYQSPELRFWLVQKLYEGIELGYVKPLPRTVFPKQEVVQAFKYMTAGKHIGKVVLKIRDEDTRAASSETFKGVARFSGDPEKSYIIVGGLGGFGLELADWLYLRGVKNLILVSRSGIQSGYQLQKIRNWRPSGMTVQISTSDVTTSQGCSVLIKEASKLGPVDGIFNLAVVLKDALFGDQTEETFDASLSPKAKATIHLDQISRNCCPQLRYFVTFSSVSCGRGNAGQTNYGTANSIMERICETRKRDGLPGLAIQWGAIGDVGLVAKLQRDNKELVIGGTLQQKISSCLEVLDKLLKQDNPVVASMVVAEKNTKSYDSGSAVEAVAYILGIKDLKTINPNTTFTELGVDSMMATEMIQILEKDFSIYITGKEIRNLTFAKLIELEGEQKTAVSKAAKGTDVLLRYIPRKEISNMSVIKIPSRVSDDENAKTVFILPGVEGVFEPMEPLTKNLDAHLLGVLYKYNNPETSIAETATTILPHVEETVSRENTFFLIGYSFGCLVATELAALLEAKGFTGTVVLIEGSPEYLAAALRLNFPLEREDEFQTTLLLKVLEILVPINQFIDQTVNFLNCKTFDERIDLALSLTSSEVTEKKLFKKEAAFALYNRFKSASNYQVVHGKIKSQVHLFKAKIPLVAEFSEDYRLSGLCEQPIQCTLVDGNHVTILNQIRLLEAVTKILITANC